MRPILRMGCATANPAMSPANSLSVGKFGHQRDGFAARDESRQVHLRVGDARGKAQLVDLPQAIEIGGAVVADDEVHTLSVQAGTVRVGKC